MLFPWLEGDVRVLRLVLLALEKPANLVVLFDWNLRRRLNAVAGQQDFLHLLIAPANFDTNLVEVAPLVHGDVLLVAVPVGGLFNRRRWRGSSGWLLDVARRNNDFFGRVKLLRDVRSAFNFR